MGETNTGEISDPGYRYFQSGLPRVVITEEEAPRFWADIPRDPLPHDLVHRALAFKAAQGMVEPPEGFVPPAPLI